MLEICLVCGSTPFNECVALQVPAASCVFACDTAIVVVDLMIVPSENPRADAMGCLQIGIEAVLCVSMAIVGQRTGLSTFTSYGLNCTPARFIDINANRKNQIGLLSRKVPVGTEEPLLIVRT